MGMGCARLIGRRNPLLIVDIDSDRLGRCVAELGREGYIAEAYTCDIADPDQVRGLETKLAGGPGVRVLAHVAAVGNAPGGWRQVMSVDLIGPHLVVRAVGPHMVAGGAAILVSSTGSYQCPRNPTIEALLNEPLRLGFFDALVDALGHEPDFLEAYFMAKQGVNRLASTLAIAWGQRQVRALSVSPGLINSTMGRTAGAMLPIYDGTEVRRLGSRDEKAGIEVPLGRQGTLLEVTSVIDFVASDAASFLNGIDIPIDGGSIALRRARGVIER